jgi:hypothetical protein
MSATAEWMFGWGPPPDTASDPRFTVTDFSSFVVVDDGGNFTVTDQRGNFTVT